MRPGARRSRPSGPVRERTTSASSAISARRSANAITHKIDQDVDNERDFIGATLQQAGWVQAMDYMTRANPIREAKTATGGSIKSDGRVLVIVLNPAQK